ncbi:hypothetical protein [Yersinia aleksiciae]|uniref:Alpha-related fimbriae major subunit n=1 Tax=Yersinia aleksiciae TaxID=263819 RepID=A0ABM5UDR7_YERAE|nr:hypothetical protein [Yersinia aleksiciae]AKP33924.1 hypothetical protein ACZ76_10395 [Yersinia aleksiciae]MDA5499174.1 hypothetical protein [Yersinia aleksiciae]NIK99872.1 hypothetical protein [Yersinia aleksiciae]WQC71032.1 hypothetical protein N0K21_00550 [Yersinia aleksiciae]CFQ49676.1 alpha-related fimbriae major subunit [Yersinia aleksiciae]
MKVKNKSLFFGLLLLILSPTAMAAPYFYSNYVKGYSNCSVKLLDDDSVEVSFLANLADNMSERRRKDDGEYISEHDNNKYDLHTEHARQWGKLIGEPNIEDITLKHQEALLSLYFYDSNNSPDTNIQLNDISDISLNKTPPINSNNSIRNIKFKTINLITYRVSFRVSPHVLKSIRIGATVGGTLASNKQEYPLLSTRGVSFHPSGNGCVFFDPQSGIAPPALKVDPKFSLASAIWQLKPVDLDHLLNNTSEDKGLHALLVNPQANEFCISYHAMGTKDTRYMINASNSHGLSADNQQFRLIEKSGKNIINYHLELEGGGGTKLSFSLPENKKFIQLRDTGGGMEQMCWSPKIRLYRTATTDKGHYSDTLNFTITPQA